MAGTSSDSIYLLGSRLNEVESVIITDRLTMQLFTYTSLQEAKEHFVQAYDLLLAPTFRPSFPPGKEEIAYHQGFMRLAAFYPVILQLDKNNYLEVFDKWRIAAALLFRTRDRFFGDLEYWHCPVRPGFLKTFGALDIVSDIESTPFIGPDGNIVIRVNEYGYADDTNRPLKPLTEEQMKEILRKRGFL